MTDRKAATMPDDIVVVCTANEARSPLLAVRLQADVDERFGPGGLRVGSAGTDATYGRPAAEGSVQVAAGWGLDLRDHQARPLLYAGLEQAGLIIVMTRRHRNAVVRHEAALAPRTLVLRRLSARLDDADRLTTDAPDPAPTRASLRQRLEGLTAAASRADTGRHRRAHDVPDPVGADQPAYDALGEEFARFSLRLVAALAQRREPGG